MFAKTVTGQYVDLDQAGTLRVLESPAGSFNVQAVEYGSEYLATYGTDAEAQEALRVLASSLGAIEL